MMKCNILCTSVGRRGYLIRYFKEALKECGLIHAANSEVDVPGMIPADKIVQSPLIHDENYIPFLLNYCKKNEISAIISFFDIDLMKLSIHRHLFEDAGVKVIVSDPDVIRICTDKWSLRAFLSKEGFSAKRAFLTLEGAREAIDKNLVNFPLVIKPRWGMGSIGVSYAENDDELELLYNYVKYSIAHSYLSIQTENMEQSVMIQEHCHGDEYNLDVINDLDAEYLITIPKRKIRMRCGETNRAVTVDQAVLHQVGEMISLKLKHIGNLDVDLFLENGKPYIIDMNARFGGGYPFSHNAGVNLPAAIVSWLTNEVANVNYFNFCYGVEGQKDINIINV